MKIVEPNNPRFFVALSVLLVMLGCLWLGVNGNPYAELAATIAYWTMGIAGIVGCFTEPTGKKITRPSWRMGVGCAINFAAVVIMGVHGWWAAWVFGIGILLAYGAHFRDYEESKE